MLPDCAHEGAAGPCMPRLADGRCIWCERELPAGWGERVLAERQRRATKRTTPPPPLEADLAPGEHFCHRCQRRTRWQWNRTKRVQHCAECRDRFPCIRACEHADCRAFIAATRAA